jgi:hypothetical protein
MRAVLALLPLFAFDCTTPPAPPAPPVPPPLAEPTPVKAEPTPEPAIADCMDLAFADGNAGTYTVVQGGESHVKHHFIMPEGKDALVMTATWSDPTWEMDMAAGIGGCPHAGTTHATVAATGSARIFLPSTQLSAETATFTAGETWFLHLGAKGDHPTGANVTYTMTGQACTIVKPKPEVPAPALAPTGEKHSAPLKATPAEAIRARKAEGGGKAPGGKGQ